MGSGGSRTVYIGGVREEGKEGSDFLCFGLYSGFFLADFLAEGPGGYTRVGLWGKGFLFQN